MFLLLDFRRLWRASAVLCGAAIGCSIAAVAQDASKERLPSEGKAAEEALPAVYIVDERTDSSLGITQICKARGIKENKPLQVVEVSHEETWKRVVKDMGLGDAGRTQVMHSMGAPEEHIARAIPIREYRYSLKVGSDTDSYSFRVTWREHKYIRENLEVEKTSNPTLKAGQILAHYRTVTYYAGVLPADVNLEKDGLSLFVHAKNTRTGWSSEAALSEPGKALTVTDEDVLRLTRQPTVVVAASEVKDDGQAILDLTIGNCCPLPRPIEAVRIGDSVSEPLGERSQKLQDGSARVSAAFRERPDLAKPIFLQWPSADLEVPCVLSGKSGEEGQDDGRSPRDGREGGG